MNTVKIKIESFTFKGQFPKLCLYCGSSMDRNITYTHEIKEKIDNENINHKMEFLLPYCEEHAKIASRNKSAQKLHYTIIALISLVVAAAIGILTFIDVGETGIFGVKSGPLLIILAALAATGIGIFVFWIVAVPLMFLSIPILDKFSQYSFRFPLGITFSKSKDTDKIEVKIRNPEIEKQFCEINSEMIIK